MAIIALMSLSCTKKVDTKPNIIFIFADDHSYNSVHAYGNNEVITPNLDKMASEGVSFTHAYNMGAWHGAVCVASRAMLNTGAFVWNANKLDNNEAMAKKTENGEMWSQLMSKAGYETYMSGKWHVKAKVPAIFDHSTHIRPGMPNQTKAGYNRPIEGQEDVWSPYDKSFEGFWKGGKHWSEVLGDDAEQFLADATTKEDPFFMYLAFNAPHDPRQAPKEYVDMYPVEDIEVPESFLPLYPDMEEIGCGRGLRDEKLAPFPRTEYSVKVNRQEYYAIISHMDAQIGRILEALKKSGKDKNTYIFFSADHGLSVGNHGLIGKQNLYDHSVRVPLMVIGPDIPKNRKVDADVYLQDIMASCLDLAGVEKPQYVEFSSLLSIAKGKQKESNYDAIYGCYRTLQRSIRTDGYKLIVYPAAKKVYLFDLKTDPLEMTNLADESDNKVKVKEMFAGLVQLQKDMNDDLDLVSVFPELQ